MGKRTKFVGMSRKGNAMFGRSGEPPEQAIQRSWEGWKSLRDTEKTGARRRTGSNITVHPWREWKGGGRWEAWRWIAMKGEDRHGRGHMWEGCLVLPDYGRGMKSAGVGRREIEVRGREGRWYGNGEREHSPNCSFTGFLALVTFWRYLFYNQSIIYSRGGKTVIWFPFKHYFQPNSF